MNAVPWPIFALLLVVGALLALLAGFERKLRPSRELAITASLAALAAAARIPFAVIPNVQPVTFLVFSSGFALGARVGAMVGVVSALLSNMVLGQGPWTPWQMIGWGLVGASGGALGRWRPKAPRWLLVLILALWGYAFGLIMDVWNWLAYVYPYTWSTLGAVYAAGFWFDTAHALSNVLFMWFAGPHILPALSRLRKRLVVTYVKEGSHV